MTKTTYVIMIILALAAVAVTIAKAEVTCTSSEFMGTTTTRCSDGSSSQSSTFMGETTTRITPPMPQPGPSSDGAIPQEWRAHQRPKS